MSTRDLLTIDDCEFSCACFSSVLFLPHSASDLTPRSQALASSGLGSAGTDEDSSSVAPRSESGDQPAGGSNGGAAAAESSSSGADDAEDADAGSSAELALDTELQTAAFLLSSGAAAAAASSSDLSSPSTTAPPSLRIPARLTNQWTREVRDTELAQSSFGSLYEKRMHVLRVRETTAITLRRLATVFSVLLLTLSFCLCCSSPCSPPSLVTRLSSSLVKRRRLNRCTAIPGRTPTTFSSDRTAPHNKIHSGPSTAAVASANNNSSSSSPHPPRRKKICSQRNQLGRSSLPVTPPANSGSQS